MKHSAKDPVRKRKKPQAGKKMLAKALLTKHLYQGTRDSTPRKFKQMRKWTMDLDRQLCLTKYTQRQ